ncbi:MAG TPA: efflux RND transporter periplasmic adaptor subunit [Thermoanaerobaculia bacterium]|nr:efflux RND transporter periplasmic adaptor subunit [Thermoanaerobaculia bacterium]
MKRPPLALSIAVAASGTAVLLLCRSAAQGGGAATPAPKPLAVASAPAARVAAEGRVVAYPGAEVVVGTDFAGTVRRLLVKERDAVRKGDLLAEIGADEQKAALAEAEARIAEAAADVKLFEFELARAEQLLASKVGARQAVDKASRDLEAARARRATAGAEAERLKATIAKSRILAPISGAVITRHVEAGETIDRGARIATVADLSRLRVEAEVDEADAARVSVGARVAIRAEGESGAGLEGRVEEIPDAVTGRRTKPLDPGKPSDTRVLLVKIAFADASRGTALKLGRRVEVEIQGGSPR